MEYQDRRETMIEVIYKIIGYAEKRGIKIYMVGGAVRDEMLKRGRNRCSAET